mmetsp:Transcript_32572/g.52410  ORF Transcript_32572/g.52410 Transcript_32572/m.52410 type:complete len:256 (+) Transcript_32572:2-769(+)
MSRRQALSLEGDEVWEGGSSGSDAGDCGSSGSECDSDVETAASPTRPRPENLSSPSKAGIAAVRISAAKTPAATVDRSISGGTTSCRLKALPLATAAAAAAVPSREGGLMGIVSHLRSDNTRLREALVQAQREMETLAATQGDCKEVQSIDFAHLLSLVKDFGDDLGGFADDNLEEAQCCGRSVEVFAISSPRSDEEPSTTAESESSADDEVALQLRSELEQSRLEVSELRWQLAAKDAELLTLRGGVDVRSSLG